MLEIGVTFDQAGKSLGLVGRTGEDSARVIVCDCAQVLEEYPGAEIVCAMRRACDAEAYAHTLTADGSAHRAVLTAADVAAPGSLMIEFRAVRDGQVLKSAVYVGRVERGLAGQTAAPGNPVADVIDRLNAQAEAARKAADAAQQMADEVRRKLEAGELNGSDAEVTAENIQSALGYAPVTPYALAAKQDALTDADRQSITTTGMTTGPAWTEAEQKAARERMVIDKAYELIETITTDGTSIVEREVEPNGTPYNFSHVRVVVTSPKNMESNITVFTIMETVDVSQSSYAVFQKDVAYFKRAMYMADVANGVLWYTSTDSTIAYADQQDKGSTDTCNIRQSPTLKATSNNIKKIRVHASNYAVLSAGFLIQVYGVRA